MIRLCAALGTWQLVMLAASLRQEARERGGSGGESRDVLLLYGRAALTPGLRGLMPRIASATWPWERIVWADDLIDEPMSAWGRSGFRGLGRALRERAGVAGGRVDQLWLSKLWGPPEKRLCEAIGEAPVTYYEDGLNDYMPRSVEPWHTAYDLGKPRELARAGLHRLDGRYRARALKRNLMMDAEQARRVSRAYLSIAEDVPPPAFLAGLPGSIIDHDLLRRSVADASAEAGGPTVDRDGGAGGPGPAVLVLGQCFWRWDGMTRSEEIRACREEVSSIIDRGYRVLWKDHPRADPPLAGPVGEGLPPDRFAVLDLPQACPVELALGRIGAAAIASASSSSLFYAPKVSGVRPYQLREHFSGVAGEFGEMIRLTSRYIEPIGDLPAAGSAEDARSACRVGGPEGARS